MTQTTNFAAKAQAANEKLNAARARMAELADIAPKAHSEAQRLTDKLHNLRTSDSGVSKQDSDAYEAEISRQISIRDAARAEKAEIESSASLKELISFTTFAAHRKDTSHADELIAARAAWAEAITPHLALVERIRAAKKTLGQNSGLLSDEELLSGVARA